MRRVQFILSLITFFVTFSLDLFATNVTATVTENSPEFRIVSLQFGIGKECRMAIGNHPYAAITFQALENTVHLIRTKELNGFYNDNFLAIYTGVFDPKNPSANLIGCNDDQETSNYLAAFKTPYALQKGKIYTAVFTGYYANTINEEDVLEYDKALTTGEAIFSISPDVTLFYGVTEGLKEL